MQSLKQRLSELRADYEQNLQVYKPGYPKMQKLQRQIDELQQEVASETGAIATSVKATYEAALRKEQAVAARLACTSSSSAATSDAFLIAFFFARCHWSLPRRCRGALSSEAPV